MLGLDVKRSLSATSSVLTCVCFALEKTADRQQRIFMSSPWLLMPGLQLICKSALYQYTKVDINNYRYSVVILALSPVHSINFCTNERITVYKCISVEC